MSFLTDTLRRKTARDDGGTGAASGAVVPIRLSGTVPTQEYQYDRTSDDGELGDANGRTGNDNYYPDNPRGQFDVETVNGQRLQDFANSHLSEGPAPGRIPHGWFRRISGKVGRDLTGNPVGDTASAITLTGNPAGGLADMMYVPHTPTPRNTTVARPYLRTVDDYAPIPGVYVADATRR